MSSVSARNAHYNMTVLDRLATDDKYALEFARKCNYRWYNNLHDAVMAFYYGA